MSEPTLVINEPTRTCCGSPPRECRCSPSRTTLTGRAAHEVAVGHNTTLTDLGVNAMTLYDPRDILALPIVFNADGDDDRDEDDEEETNPFATDSDTSPQERTPIVNQGRVVGYESSGASSGPLLPFDPDEVG